MNDSVIILAAGKGTRMGPYSDTIPKGLLPVGDKAVISHIIEKFPSDTLFVIAIGHLGHMIRAYVTLAHPGLSVIFVEVDVDFEPAGPGVTLMACQQSLPKGLPFYIVNSDTLFDLPADTSGSWIGVQYTNDPDSYCNVILDQDGSVLELHDKRASPGSVAFTGLARIETPDVFWDQLDYRGPFPSSIVRWLNIRSFRLYCPYINAYARMADCVGLGTRFHPWDDTGTYDKYRDVAEAHNTFAFEKEGEFLYRVGDRIVKYFANPKTTYDRVSKATMRTDVFPQIVGSCGSFYAYEFVPGQTLYEAPTPEKFADLLVFLRENVWEAVGPLDPYATKTFYIDKSRARLKAFLERNPDVDGRDMTNMLTQRPLHPAVASFIHGDLQFDNILETPDGFVLIDWRQDFAGRVEIGDLYYDFAKLLAGIQCDFRSVKDSPPAQDLGLLRPIDGAPAYVEILKEEAALHGLDYAVIENVAGLIYLNMAGLHGNPLDLHFFKLAQLVLKYGFDPQAPRI